MYIVMNLVTTQEQPSGYHVSSLSWNTNKEMLCVLCCCLQFAAILLGYAMVHLFIALVKF